MANYKNIVENNKSNHWNIRDDLKGLPLEEIKAINNADRLPYAVCALNITGDLNIGIMLRTACLLGASEFFIIGRRQYDKRSTVGAQHFMKVHRYDGMVDDVTIDSQYVLTILHSRGFTPISIECGGTDIMEVNFNMIKKPCLIVGNEGFGVPDEITNQTQIVSIPQLGVLRSLNVSSAASIAMHQVMRSLKGDNE